MVCTPTLPEGVPVLAPTVPSTTDSMSDSVPNFELVPDCALPWPRPALGDNKRKLAGGVPETKGIPEAGKLVDSMVTEQAIGLLPLICAYSGSAIVSKIVF